MISGQLGREERTRSKEFEGFIKQVMELSIKNKEMLKEMSSMENSHV